jgi:hypothetical protein
MAKKWAAACSPMWLPIGDPCPAACIAFLARLKQLKEGEQKMKDIVSACCMSPSLQSACILP